MQKKRHTINFFIYSIQSRPCINITILFNCLTCRIAEKLKKMMSQEFGMHLLKNKLFTSIGSISCCIHEMIGFGKFNNCVHWHNCERAISPGKTCMILCQFDIVI